jgi:hypothetical protein
MINAIVVTRVKRDTEIKQLVPIRNLVEVTDREEGGSWCKYWNGEGERSMVIIESPQEVADLCNK